MICGLITLGSTGMELHQRFDGWSRFAARRVLRPTFVLSPALYVPIQGRQSGDDHEWPDAGDRRYRARIVGGVCGTSERVVSAAAALAGTRRIRLLPADALVSGWDPSFVGHNAALEVFDQRHHASNGRDCLTLAVKQSVRCFRRAGRRTTWMAGSIGALLCTGLIALLSVSVVVLRAANQEVGSVQRLHRAATQHMIWLKLLEERASGIEESLAQRDHDLGLSPWALMSLAESLPPGVLIERFTASGTDFVIETSGGSAFAAAERLAAMPLVFDVAVETVDGDTGVESGLIRGNLQR